MSWLIGILGAIAALLYGMYQLGPGMNNRKQQKKNEDWVNKWKDLMGGGNRNKK